MPKAVDRVESGIDLARQRKGGHVSHKRCFAMPPPSKPVVAKVDHGWFEIAAANLKIRVGQAVEQPASAACRLEDSLHGASRMLLETAEQEVVLGFPVGTEDEIVVLGKIVKILIGPEMLVLIVGVASGMIL